MRNLENKVNQDKMFSTDADVVASFPSQVIDALRSANYGHLPSLQILNLVSFREEYSLLSNQLVADRNFLRTAYQNDQIDAAQAKNLMNQALNHFLSGVVSLASTYNDLLCEYKQGYIDQYGNDIEREVKKVSKPLDLTPAIKVEVEEESNDEPAVSEVTIVEDSKIESVVSEVILVEDLQDKSELDHLLTGTETIVSHTVETNEEENKMQVNTEVNNEVISEATIKEDSVKESVINEAAINEVNLKEESVKDSGTFVVPAHLANLNYEDKDYSFEEVDYIVDLVEKSTAKLLEEATFEDKKDWELTPSTYTEDKDGFILTYKCRITTSRFVGGANGPMVLRQTDTDAKSYLMDANYKAWKIKVAAEHARRDAELAMW